MTGRDNQYMLTGNKHSIYNITNPLWCKVTHHEAVLERTDWQPVDGLVDAAVDGSALAPKALGVDDAGFPLF